MPSAVKQAFQPDPGSMDSVLLEQRYESVRLGTHMCVYALTRLLLQAVAFRPVS